MRFTDLRVISRNSTFRYKDRPVDVRKIREELAARYIVDGSIGRTADNRDPSATAVFEVQDEITGRAVAAIVSKLGRNRPARAQRGPSQTAA